MLAARQHCRQAFAHMTNDESELRISVQGAGDSETHDMQRGLVMPTPGKSREPEADLRREALVVGLAHRRGRHSGMDVKGHIELLGPTQQRSKPSVIEEGAPDGSTDQRAFVA